MASITMPQLIRALEGKALERGLRPVTDESAGRLVVDYGESLGSTPHALHTQAMRNLVKRLAPGWRLQINTYDERSGFELQVWPPPNAAIATAPGEAQVLAALARLEEKIDSLLDQLAKD